MKAEATVVSPYHVLLCTSIIESRLFELISLLRNSIPMKAKFVILTVGEKTVSFKTGGNRLGLIKQSFNSVVGICLPITSESKRQAKR